MTSYKDRARSVKAILSKEYGAKNVSVRMGHGTARGWLHVVVKEAPPRTCVCRSNFLRIGCVLCRQIYVIERVKIMDLLKDIEFSTYSPDDGTDESKQCVLVEVQRLVL